MFMPSEIAACRANPLMVHALVDFSIEIEILEGSKILPVDLACRKEVKGNQARHLNLLQVCMVENGIAVQTQ